MKKLVLVLALVLGGCSTIQTLQQVAGTAVTPTQAIVAANAFDAAESGATGYLVYCKANITAANCALATRQAVISYVRAGRAARNQIETAITNSSTIPTTLYNALVAAVTNLKASPAATFVGAN
jgi:uncharacterized protein YceK